MNKTFLQWLTQDYLSQESIIIAYEKELQKRHTGMTHSLIAQLKDKLSPCKNCTSYATCHRTGAQICQRAAQVNDIIVQTVEEAVQAAIEEDKRSLAEISKELTQNE